NDADPSGTGLVLEEIIVEPVYGEISFTSDGEITYIPDGIFSGTDVLIYEVSNAEELSDISTLTIFIQDASACVWPGDANDNGVANNVDLLFVGLFYGNEGPTRFVAGDEWESNYCDEWEDDDDIVIPLNPKYADCNGDGLVDANDTVPIKINYGQEHLKMTEISGGESFPPLAVSFFTDSIEGGSTVVLPIIFGSIDYPATNVLGLAFTLEYNADFVVSGSLKANFNTGWLGAEGDNLIKINRDDSLGNFAVGVTRINHTPASGYGPIGTVSFVMEDNIAGKTSDLIAEIFTLCPVQPSVINDAGEIKGAEALNVYCDSVVIYQVFNDVADAIKSGIQIFPNPADKEIWMEWNAHGFTAVEIFDIYGRKIRSQSMAANSSKMHLDTSELEEGAYILILRKDDNLFMERIIIQHN
ncbi:MAG: T9SS type A sorting domain-containing protein, partial [Chitinophagales bacterium]